MKLIHQLSEISRVVGIDGKHVLQALMGDNWVTVFTPPPIRLPEGFQTVRSS